MGPAKPARGVLLVAGISRALGEPPSQDSFTGTGAVAWTRETATVAGSFVTWQEQDCRC